MNFYFKEFSCSGSIISCSFCFVFLCWGMLMIAARPNLLGLNHITHFHLYETFKNQINRTRLENLHYLWRKSVSITRIMCNNTCCLIAVNGLAVSLPKACQGELLCLRNNICSKILQVI